MLARSIAFGFIFLISSFARAECLHDDLDDVRIRVQDHMKAVYQEVCSGKPEDLQFHYIDTWQPTGAPRSEMVAEQAFHLSDDQSGRCLSRFSERMISDGVSGKGPNCSLFRIYKTEFYSTADAGPTFLFFMSSDAEAHINPAADPVLYQQSGGQLFDGGYGKIAEIQKTANTKLKECHLEANISVDGKFGGRTKKAIARLATCPAVRTKLPDNSEARHGAVTVGLWNVLFDNIPAPNVDTRTVAILLSFEATDYTRAEWNFCQNKPLYNPDGGQNKCYSNDKRSYLTWGPHGATAGHGQEVLAIAALVDNENSKLLNNAFGNEVSSVRRAIKMRDSDNGDLERFLCGKWIDAETNNAWKSGFNALGKEETVRRVYDRLYKASNFDGGKMTVFFDAWQKAGLQPTEIDYAFFVDRSAHTTPNEGAIVNALNDAQSAAEGSLTAAQARRAVALAVLPGNPDQRKDRLGRDVTFYVDELEGQLTAEERTSWIGGKKLRASDIGLSDERPAPRFLAEPPVKWKPSGQETLL